MSSKIQLSTVSSTGTYLNNAPVLQHRFIKMHLEDPEGKILADIAMTFEQFSEMMTSNMSISCTLTRYRDTSGNLKEEKVPPPQTIEDKMSDRLGTVQKDLENMISDIHKSVYEMVNGSVNKTKMKELLHNLQVLKGNFKANQNFTVQESMEELHEMQSNVRSQIMSFVQSLGGNITEDAIKKLEGSSVKYLPEPEKAVPVPLNYTPKVFQEKAIEDMTAMELADNIGKELRRIEATQPRNIENSKLYSSGCMNTGPKLLVWYISFQGKHSIELNKAREYLKFLRTVKDYKTFRTDFHFDGK